MRPPSTLTPQIQRIASARGNKTQTSMFHVGQTTAAFRSFFGIFIPPSWVDYSTLLS